MTAPQLCRGRDISAPCPYVSLAGIALTPIPVLTLQESPGSPLTPTHTCRAHGELLTEPSSVDSSAAWRTGVRPLRITKPEKMQLGSLQKLVFQTSPQNFIRSFGDRRQIRAYFLQHMGSPQTRVPIQQCGPPSPSSPVPMMLRCPPASLCSSTA